MLSLRRVACVAGLTVAFWAVVIADAAVGVYTGREPKFWSESHHSLILARVCDEATHVDGADSKFLLHMTIEPLATLAGEFDPSKHSKQDVRFYVGTPTIPEAPGEGTIVLAVVQDGNFVISDACQFMPHGAPMVAIDGLSDSRVLATLKKVREARAHPYPQ